MVTAVSDRVMALAGIISAVSGDAADLLACRDLAEQVGQDWCIADMAPGDLDAFASFTSRKAPAQKAIKKRPPDLGAATAHRFSHLSQ